jgi:starch phosphorylase
MREHVGAENIVIFGLTAEEVADRRANGYKPREIIEASPELSQALSAISSGVFSSDAPDRYRDLLNGIFDHDWFMVAADFDSYSDSQRRIDELWRDSPNWNAMAIRNVARMGWFSSDRTIRQYATEIWNVPHE